MSESTYPEKLKNIKRNMAKLSQGNGEMMKAFSSLHQTATKGGALDTKTKELMALAIGVATHCEGCIAYHLEAALDGGATREEVMETLGVAVLMGGGPAVIYSTKAAEALGQFLEARGG